MLLNDLVKDLRSRRVFSPSSELSKEISDQKLGAKFGYDESEDDDAKKAKNEGFESSFSCQNGNTDEKKATENEENGKVDLGFEYKAQKFDDASGDSKIIKGLNEHFVRTTPPGAKMSIDSGVGEKCGNGMESSVEKSTNGSTQKIESDSKTKVVRPSDLIKLSFLYGSLRLNLLVLFLLSLILFWITMLIT